jgi:micrococcal nuclease
MAMYEYEATIIRVIDGDTVVASVDLGFHTHRVETLRVTYWNGAKYDAPETTRRNGVTQAEKKKGLEAKAFAKELLPAGIKVKIKTKYDKRGKYGRFLAAIRLPNGNDFAGIMSVEGYMKP